MKNQALARVFSVVLAILCAILLVTGITGFGKAGDERAEREAYAEKITRRITTYRALDGRMQNSISYDEAQAEVERLQAEHEANASRHRTDLALYTAERGGNLMGADLIWEALPEVQVIRQDLERARQEFDAFAAAYASVRGETELLMNIARDGSAASGTAYEDLQQSAARVGALLAVEPQLPEGFSVPDDPGERPEQPTEPALPAPTAPEGERPSPPEEPGEDADGQALADYEQALADYQQALEPWLAYDAEQAAYDAAWEEYRALQAEYESYPARRLAYETALAQQAAYDRAHAAWEEQLARELEDMRLTQGAQALGVLAGNMQELAQRGNNILNILRPYSDQLGQLGIPIPNLAGLQRLAALQDADIENMTPQQRMEAASAIASAIQELSGSFDAAGFDLARIDEAVSAAQYAVYKAEQEVKKAEQELHSQLANIWYHLDLLAEQAAELAEERDELAEEYALLSRQLLEADELRALRNQFNSARQLLINIPEVRAMEGESGDLPGSAERYVASWREQTGALYRDRLLIHTLAIAAAVCGILGIPAAYEKLKKRLFLIAPVLLCLLLSAAAEWRQVSLGLGQHYAALFTAIFAALQLLIVMPRKRQ